MQHLMVLFPQGISIIPCLILSKILIEVGVNAGTVLILLIIQKSRVQFFFLFQLTALHISIPENFALQGRCVIPDL
jgi:hypothetical protein